MSELIDKPNVDDSTNLTVDALDVIVGTNSQLSSVYQMSDPIMQWLKELIIERDASNGQSSQPKRANMKKIQRKLIKHLPSFKIIKDLIYFMDKDKLGNEQKRYVYPKGEIKSTIQEMHCKETAGHLGTDKTIEKIKSRFFWISLNSDVRKPTLFKLIQDIFGSDQDINGHYYGHGGSIARNTER